MLTIFTPTYNRAKTLNRLYVSLVNQTNKNFIWYVVDDGSTDMTKTIIESYIKDNKIRIKYKFQNNSGKHIAYNNAITNCDTELFTIVDSDDYLLPNFIEEINQNWKKIRKIGCIGIISFRKYENSKLTTIKNNNIKYSTLKDAYDKLGLKGDAVLTYKTKSIKNYLFPEIKGERFCPEIYLYDILDNVGTMYILRKALYICEYLPGGLSDNWVHLIKDNPKAYNKTIINRINIDKTLWLKYKDNIRYVMYSKLGSTNKIIKNSPTKLLTILAYIPGKILSVYLRKRK